MDTSKSSEELKQPTFLNLPLKSITQQQKQQKASCLYNQTELCPVLLYIRSSKKLSVASDKLILDFKTQRAIPSISRSSFENIVDVWKH